MANFLMFTASEEKNTGKCLEGSSDIFGNGLRKSSEIIQNSREMAKNSLIY